MILGRCRFLGVPDNGRVWAGGHVPLALSFLYPEGVMCLFCGYPNMGLSDACFSLNIH